MAQIEDGLSRGQAIALIRETTAARNLLGYGLLALRRTRFVDTTRDPILTMLSIGAEKTFKMALGLVNVAAEQRWLGKNVLKNHYRHDLVLMDRTLREQLRQRLDNATYPAIVGPLLDAVDSNPLWEPMISMLDRYGREGRFYNLDALAEYDQPDDDPEEYWNRVEQIAIEEVPAVAREWNAVTGDYSKMDRFTATLNEAMAETIEAGWRMICMAGVQGVMGDRGKGWGFDLDPSMVGRQE
ncbi:MULTISPECIES: hypothetical protein [unclassified Leifsonia]|uniref:hypothetical protein n=1 Tax=unclassified Leifsonia TaxID=2663824 RepID=UPI001113C0A8|nr:MULTISPECIES: hypothetical protein [unclassified Leifsonia]